MNKYYDLGMALCEWHASGSDPVYAVGSTMIAGKFDPNTYPSDVMCACIRNLMRNDDPDCDAIVRALLPILESMNGYN